MYSKIMVPLDGSALAEKALPYAIRLARRLNANLLLIRATEVPALLTDTVTHELEVIREAEKYLTQVRTAITDPALEPHIAPEKVRTLVAYGDTVRELTEMATFEKADLMIMSTHGRTGLSRLTMGSVANRILQHVTLPVVLIHPKKFDQHELLAETLAEPLELKLDDNHCSIVVTLDGTPEGETVLETAAEIALAVKATVHLLSVVVPYGAMNYGDPVLIYSLDPEQETETRREEADQYLEKAQAQLTARGINCVKVVRVADAASEIIDYALKNEAALILMATHARNRVGQILLGSVSDDVVRQSHLPIVMVHTLRHAKVTEPDEEGLTASGMGVGGVNLV